MEALSQLACGEQAVLLAAFDTRATGPLAAISRSDGLLGGALVLARDGRGPRLAAWLEDGRAPVAAGPLARHGAGNAMAPMLVLFDALAANIPQSILPAGADRTLRIELTHD